MKNFRSIAFLSLSLSICIGSSFGQPPPATPAAALQDQDLVTVYIYRLDEDAVVSNLFFWFIKARPVYLGDPPVAGTKPSYRKIAALRNREYFMMRLPPKKYIFKTRSMWGRLEVNLTTGAEFYLWVDQGNDCPSEDSNWTGTSTCEDRTASIVKATSERWEKDKAGLKPIRDKQVKDKSLVVIPSGSPK